MQRRFKEERVNQATQSIVRAVEYLAEKEGETSEEMMTKLMDNPASLLPLLFSQENMKEFMPEGMREVSAHMSQHASGSACRTCAR
jgi:lipopolysaccharide biosynthesis protein